MSIWKKLHFALWSVKMFFLVNYYCIKYKKIWKNIVQYQGEFEGERCFVIGNGPSLNKEDLDTLKDNNAFTFASNRIYKMYDKTNWRPSFYSVCDEKLYIDNSETIDRLNETAKFLPLDIAHVVRDKSKYYFFARYPFKLFSKYPTFKNNILHKFGEGNTVTYHLIQLAVCMGFKEIYLLGCDFSYNIGVDQNGKIIKDSGQKNYPWKEESVLYNLPNLQANLYAYIAAKRYCDNHGIIIKNATRGGKLEVFERVTFDELFS